jgi:hypothetical protein
MPNFHFPKLLDVEQGLPDWVGKLPKLERKEVIRKLTAAIGIIEGTRSSGAGYLMDRQLREFFSEYNARIFNYGNDHLLPVMTYQVGLLADDEPAQAR